VDCELHSAPDAPRRVRHQLQFCPLPVFGDEVSFGR
jgi:hypothetical protein